MGEMCNCPSWVIGVFGILFLIIGYLLYSAYFTLDQGIGIMIMLFGLMKLSRFYAPRK